MGLPCRHVFASRIEDGEEILFQPDDILPRWHIGYDKDLVIKRPNPSDQQNEGTYIRAKVTKLLERNIAPKSKDDKFWDMMGLCKSLCDLASTQGTQEFMEKMFSMAMATSLCKGRDPSRIVFHQKLMRSHLLMRRVRENSQVGKRI